MPRTRATSAEAPSTRSTRSTRSSKSRRSAGSGHSTESAASTQATSVSDSSQSQDVNMPLAPTTTPADISPSVLGPNDAYDPATAQQVNLVHMDNMARYLQLPETQQRLDTMLHIIKDREGGGGGGGDENGGDPDFQTALSELDYLEGLFKKLRFSYKEQLTKETVVRRILEVELPLLSAADIDRMAQDTEAERRQLRQIKSQAHEQGAAAEAMIRDLTNERRYIATAESGMVSLPDRLLRLRHRLARMKLAIAAELQAIDAMTEPDKAGTDSEATFPCTTCRQQFHTQAFQQLHQSLHNNTNRADVEGPFDDPTMSSVPEATLQECPYKSCHQKVPALLVKNAPSGETHEALHKRIREETDRAREALEKTSLDKMEWDFTEDTDEAIAKLQASEGELAEKAAWVRDEAERQAAIEKETTTSLQHLREAVGSLRAEMRRLEAEADRRAQDMQGGGRTTSVGRTLQEQTDLLTELLADDADDEM